MEATEQIKKFQEFFDLNYKAELLEKISKGEKFIIVNFLELSKFDPELADLLLDQPEEVIKAAELAIETEYLENEKNFKVRFYNLPASQKILVRNIRSSHIGKFLRIDGIVRQKSDVRPQVVSAKFECPSCGNVISILQVDTTFKEPSRCGCGRKGKFRLIDKELVDAQRIILEETPEDLEGGEQPKRMSIFLKYDLVSPMSEKRTNPGVKISITGYVKEVPLISRTGGQSTRFDLMVEGNCVESVEEEYLDIVINKKEEEKIKKLSIDTNLYKKMTDSISPSIYGYDKIKEALVLQLFSGVRKVRGGVSTRGDIHILLIGDPGSGKSQILKRINNVAPKGRYVSGKGISGAGLTASVVKDEFLRGWALEAGALVLANKGICMIDEMDKMTEEDRSAMHEALEQQTVSISKANIQATLMARTTVLAAANPKLGRFDPSGNIAEQINLPPTLINRFDLIFPIMDFPDKIKDDNMAKFILGLHQNPEIEEPEIDTKLLRKYIAYAKQNVFPKLTDAASEEIKKYYVDMRNKETDEKSKRVPVSPRQLEALVRLSEAYARIRLSDKVSKKDAKRAVDMLHYCLNLIGIDPETGKIDIDRIATGISATERSKIISVKEIIAELESSIGKTIPIDEVVRLAVEKGINEDKVEEAIEKLKRSGDVFEPRKGFVQKI